MYDNLPFYTCDKITIQKFLESNLLERVHESVDYKRSTGEQYTKSILYKYFNLTIRVSFFESGDYKELRSRGSFHYLKNKGLHNADMVNCYDAIEFLISFGKLFDIDLKTLKLTPPEFATMIQLPFDIEKTVQHTFFEQRKGFVVNVPGKPSKISGKVSNDYRLKVYSKHHEFPLYCEPNTLRLEYQAKKMRALHKLGIYTMHDLLSAENWIKIRELHLRYFEHLLIYDYTIRSPKDIRVKRKLHEYRNQIYWENLVKDSKNTDKYNRELVKLNNLSKKYGSNITAEIMIMVSKYWDWFLKTLR